MNWFDMGSHTFFVWLAYGVSFAALFYICFTSLSQKRKALRQLEKLKQRQAVEGQR